MSTCTIFCFVFFTKRHIFFFYIAPLLDFYRTGISYFEIDHVSFNSYFEFFFFYSNELQYCFISFLLS